MINETEFSKENRLELCKLSGFPFNGDKILFLLKGEELALADLPQFSTSVIRMTIAEMLGIKAFDDYHIIRASNGKVLKASKIGGLSVTDYDTNYGQSEGLKYKYFLERHKGNCCPRCGYFDIKTRTV